MDRWNHSGMGPTGKSLGYHLHVLKPLRAVRLDLCAPVGRFQIANYCVEPQVSKILCTSLVRAKPTKRPVLWPSKAIAYDDALRSGKS